jgi:hypothetical protein
MGIFLDIKNTGRLLFSRETLFGSHRNPYVNHVSSCFLIGLSLFLVGGWLALSRDLFLGCAVSLASAPFLVYWRHILPKALWHAQVERTIDRN